MDILNEVKGDAFVRRKAAPGTVQFPKSDHGDPHIKTIINTIAAGLDTIDTEAGPVEATPENILALIKSKITKMDDMSKKAPILYGTMKNNVPENELFRLLMKSDIQTQAPKFKAKTFRKLMLAMMGNIDEFFPLRSFLDKRPVKNPEIQFVNNPDLDGPGVTTAAATPNGQFIFNVPFMQKLMDYSNLKGVKPKSAKYKSSGGPFPDEYAYLEFLLMHEFMHYSHDDFHYQHMIPNAKHEIINWVGDFRSNYLLTKSGFEPLPIGLFNDSINYDRQQEYIEMYNLVKSEFENLSKDEQNEVQQTMDGMSDDHGPGQEQGGSGEAQEKVDDSGASMDDVDKQADKIEEQMGGAKDEAEGEAPKADDTGEGEDGSGKGKGKGTGTGHGTGQDIDYSNVTYSYNWQSMINRFIQSGEIKTEETYKKPAKKSVATATTVQQIGAGAVLPGQREMDEAEIKIAFVIDSSGSMSGVISKVMVNAVNLLKQDRFRNTVATVYKFSSLFDIFKVNFGRDRAAKVSSVKDKPKQMDLKVKDVFGKHLAYGTTFGDALANDIIQSLDDGYNVICFLDSGTNYGAEFENLKRVVNHNSTQVFIIFDERNTYIEFRKKAGATKNMTYFD